MVPNSIPKLLKLLDDEEFNCCSKNDFTVAFTRDRKLNFKNLVMFLANGVKSSLQRELDSFFQEETGTDINIRQVTKGALTQSRAKLSHHRSSCFQGCIGKEG